VRSSLLHEGRVGRRIDDGIAPDRGTFGRSLSERY
jgi:hypothetical protein